MNPVRVCVDGFIWNSDLKLPVNVLLRGPTVVSSIMFLIWFLVGVVFFIVDVFKQRKHALIMIIQTW